MGQAAYKGAPKGGGGGQGAAGGKSVEGGAERWRDGGWREGATRCYAHTPRPRPGRALQEEVHAMRRLLNRTSRCGHQPG